MISNTRHPAMSDRGSHPEKATADDYRQLMQRLGSARQVVVQPSAYGTDSRLAAHASFGFGPPGALRAEAWYGSEHRQEGERAWEARHGTLSRLGS